ncbi:MAG: hypothetical protein DRH10_07995, partial [Deltaproteobacteria bacterium]
MKRFQCFVFGWSVLMVVILPFSAHAALVVGKITRLKGKAEIIREAVPTPITASLGMGLELRDR